MDLPQRGQMLVSGMPEGPSALTAHLPKLTAKNSRNLSRGCGDFENARRDARANLAYIMHRRCLSHAKVYAAKGPR